MMKNTNQIGVAELSLPKGGGSIGGMKEAFNAAGPDGTISLSIPLPISAGRGFAPSLALNYSNGGGNGAFGIGWNCGVMQIRRSTKKGSPSYTKDDQFLGPEGEDLVVALKNNGQPDISLRWNIDTQYEVTCYQPLIESHFSKVEYWISVENGAADDFWLISTADGQKHILGKTAQACVAHSEHPEEIAQWLIEESVSPTGEHIYYQYRAEDNAACSEEELQEHPNAFSQRYLSNIYYGNVTPEVKLYCLMGMVPIDNNWLFCLKFDYGERDPSIYSLPTWEVEDAKTWQARPDVFSSYDFGFEVRTRRLCHQVLMFHALSSLAAGSHQGDTPALVGRLILSYAESKSITTLTSVRQLAHEHNNSGIPVLLPPLEFAYQEFRTKGMQNWRPMEELLQFNGLQRYQLIDLYGEGIPGILYQENLCWYYREPLRATAGGNAVTFGDKTPLPAIPNQQERAMLMDLTNSGRLDWVVTNSNVCGYHSQQSDGTWTHFMPISAIPSEYFHPAAQLVDLMGEGFHDLVLIGPRSVRLYPGRQDGWSNAQNTDSVNMLLLGRDARKLVGFSDMLGSGQQHLIEVTADGVRCWPNLGRGRFGNVLHIKGFSQPWENFNPNQVYLADVDGSGTTDLIYATPDKLLIYLNQSGNSFHGPFKLKLPEGVRFDDTCQLQIADSRGLGVSSLILTIPHLNPQHWCCDLALHKPWLLNATNNNMGAQHNLDYRSSAQFWLDDKATALKKGLRIYSSLPFPIHLHWKTTVLDEITGNQLVTEMHYSHGVWDSKKREFRGFGRVEQLDTTAASLGTATERSFPSKSINWFSTGIKEIDDAFASEYWQGQNTFYDRLTTYYTVWDETAGSDVSIDPSNEQRYWLNRALKGQLLRSELYGLDQSSLETLPYTISESRYQVRMIPTSNPSKPAAIVFSLETINVQSERIVGDERRSQTIQLRVDEFGFPLASVSILYPRFPRTYNVQYPDTLPESLVENSYDPQQEVLHFTRQRNRWHHLHENDQWRLGIPELQRSDAYSHNINTTEIPKKILSFEYFLANAERVFDEKISVFLGQQKTIYTCDGVKEATKPSVQALVAYIETAVLESNDLPVVTGVDVNKKIIDGGYNLTQLFFDDHSGKKVWSVQSNFITYDPRIFWRISSQKNTHLTGKTELFWDDLGCVVRMTINAAGFVTKARYDYRFLLPVQIIDVNENHHIIRLDALGRVISGRFWGTESGVNAGYSLPNKPFTLPRTIEEAINMVDRIPVAQCVIFSIHSWMRQATKEEIASGIFRNSTSNANADNRPLITEDGFIYGLAWQRELSHHESIGSVSNVRKPPHLLVMMTDRYDDDSLQQINQQVTFFDGFGRILQNSTRHDVGDAWIRTAEGQLQVKNDSIESAYTLSRWAVSGRTEYDNKGQVIRSYQPYFLNDWGYVCDDSARSDLFSETHYYDSLGREIKVVTAKGYLRLTHYFPWFVVSEDENDTAALLSLRCEESGANECT